MRVLVTGAAGFIGSHVTEKLLDEGHSVVAVDKITDYYDRSMKLGNRGGYLTHPRVEFLEADVASDEVLSRVAEVDLVLHLAAQPGVRPSWTDFPNYLRENVAVTHRLLEAARAVPNPPRMVLASSSSVYGNATTYPCAETDPTVPVSPYGVSKLAMERLVSAYVSAFGLPIVSLRYFTVYGPRQRPDMAFHRFIEHALAGEPVPVYGSGEQIREFTYVDDVAAATIRAGIAPVEPGTVLNVCGGQAMTVNEVLDVLGELLGQPVAVERSGMATGDVRRTGGSTELAERLLGWTPTVDVRTGLARQIAWHRTREDLRAASVLEDVRQTIDSTAADSAAAGLLEWR